MPYLITNKCTNCGKCESVCPTNAIYPKGIEWMLGDISKFKKESSSKLYDGNIVNIKTLQPPIEDDKYYIVPEKCTDCFGEKEKRCVEVCPENCCIVDNDLAYYATKDTQDDVIDQKEEELTNEVTIQTDSPEKRKLIYFSYQKNDEHYYKLLCKYLHSFVESISDEDWVDDLCLNKASKRDDLQIILSTTKIVVLLVTAKYLKNKDLIEKITKAMIASNKELIVRYLLINHTPTKELENKRIGLVSDIDSLAEPLSSYFQLNTHKEKPLIFLDDNRENQFVTMCREIIKLYYL